MGTKRTGMKRNTKNFYRFFCHFSQLEEFLRVLHCVEVFLEIAALQVGGPTARWALIFSIQVCNTLGLIGIKRDLVY